MATLSWYYFSVVVVLFRTKATEKTTQTYPLLVQIHRTLVIYTISRYEINFNIFFSLTSFVRGFRVVGAAFFAPFSIVRWIVLNRNRQKKKLTDFKIRLDRFIPILCVCCRWLRLDECVRKLLHCFDSSSLFFRLFSFPILTLLWHYCFVDSLRSSHSNANLIVTVAKRRCHYWMRYVLSLLLRSRDLSYFDGSMVCIYFHLPVFSLLFGLANR